MSETTESAPNRIDLDGLSAALTAAGWKREDFSVGTVFTLEDMDTIYWRERRFIDVSRWGVILVGWQARDYQEGAQWHVSSGVTEVTDPIWQHALDLIRQFTASGRSRDQAGMAGEETR